MFIMIDNKISLDKTYWMNLGVGYYPIIEMDSEKINNTIDTLFNSLNKKELIELSILLDISASVDDKKETLIQNLINLSTDIKKGILLLNDFQRRKKRTIRHFYAINNENMEYNFSLSQLYSMYILNTESLFNILTYHYWVTRSTGKVLLFESDINDDLAKDVLLKEKVKNEFLTKLIDSSNYENDYRLFSYAILNNTEFIGLIYKMVSDAPVADFDNAIRNKGVDLLLFKISTKDNYIEIKTKVEFELNAIKSFMERHFNRNLTNNKIDVFDQYDKETVLTLLMSDKTSDNKLIHDFLIDEVAFQSSPLVNSPEILLKTDRKSIWPSVMEAHDKGAINIGSLKDIKSLSIRSRGVSRKIRSILRDNGNVIFTMDDSNLDTEIKKHIEHSFKRKFSIPLYQEIVNTQFTDGSADKINYLMNRTDYLNLKNASDNDMNLLNNLIDNDILTTNTIKYIQCTNKSCNYEVLDDDYNPLECPLCDDEIKTITQDELELNMNKINNLVKITLEEWCSEHNFTFKSKSTITINEQKYEFMKAQFTNDDKSIYFYVTNTIMDRRTITKIHKLMNPTIIIFVGHLEKYISDYSTECIQAITFGTLFAQDDNQKLHLITKLYNNLKLSTKNYVASAANKAYHSINNLNGNPEMISSDYKSSDLEDDGFTIIKDLFPNSVKWGNEMIGKTLPEGAFTLFFQERNKKKLNLFSFDFKLTKKNSGYALGINEQRKAIDYINNMNDSHFISNNIHTGMLRGHIFISNKFKETDKVSVINFFKENLDEDILTKPIFMTTEVLCYFHSKYRENYEKVNLSINYYMASIYNVLTNNSNTIEKDNIDLVFSRLITGNYDSIDTLPMDELTKDQIGEYNID